MHKRIPSKIYQTRIENNQMKIDLVFIDILMEIASGFSEKIIKGLKIKYIKPVIYSVIEPQKKG